MILKATEVQFVPARKFCSCLTVVRFCRTTGNQTAKAVLTGSAEAEATLPQKAHSHAPVHIQSIPR